MDQQAVSESNSNDSGSENAVPVIVLPEHCGISQVSVVWDHYLSILTKADTVELDASAVAQTDMAGLQLVLAMVRDLKRMGRTWRWVGRSERFDASAELAGLHSLIAA